MPDKNKKLGKKEGDPIYDDKDDIFEKEKRGNVDPDEIDDDDIVEDDLSDEELHDELDEDLDIPGTDLDDKDELIGEEDEENNFYSLGGDDHDDLEDSEDD